MVKSESDDQNYEFVDFSRLNGVKEKSLKLRSTGDKVNTSNTFKQHEHDNKGLFFTL